MIKCNMGVSKVEGPAVVIFAELEIVIRQVYEGLMENDDDDGTEARRTIYKIVENALTDERYEDKETSERLDKAIDLIKELKSLLEDEDDDE